MPRLTFGFILLVFSILVRAEAEATDAGLANTTDVVEEILVVGEQPGPGLWKVSKGDHVLWIMGTLKPLPKKMTWHSQHVEDVLAQSQEYITPPAVSMKVSTWDKIKLLPSLIGVRNNPDNQKLQDILSPELYERWLVLKEKYIGRNNTVEKWRPIFAAHELYEKTIEKSGLSNSTDIMDVLREVAEKNNVKKAGPGTLTHIKNPKAIVKKFKQEPLDDIECFTKTIERLETDLSSMKARANAWATGDIATLKALTYVDNDEACRSAVFNAALTQEHGFQDVPARKQQYWLAEAEASLAVHASTFSILPVADLLKPGGYLEALQEKGYVIESP